MSNRNFINIEQWLLNSGFDLSDFFFFGTNSYRLGDSRIFLWISSFPLGVEILVEISKAKCLQMVVRRLYLNSDVLSYDKLPWTLPAQG